MIRTSIFIGGTRISDHDFTSVHINQPIGGHHDFEIRLRQDAKKGVLLEKAKSWIGQPVKIGIGDKDDVQISGSPIQDMFNGLVTSIGLSRQSGTGELIVRGNSPTVVMDDGPTTMSYTSKSLQEIIDKIVNVYKSAFKESPVIDPKILKKVIPYSVQYKESNFAYLARLANRYGEWFFYDGLKLFFGKPSFGKSIVLDFGEDNLSYFDISVQAVPAQFEIRGYDYLKHEPLKEEAPLVTANNDLGKQALDIANGQIYTQTPTVSIQTNLDKDELKNLVERREQINLDEMVILNGSSRNSKLKIGAKVELKDELIGENYGAFVITNLIHNIGQGGDYVNSFEAVPVEVLTPPLTSMPDPPFCETQLAIVTDVDDEKGLGRIRVKFMWQEGSSEKSPWIRVASPYTGKDKGFYIIPEVDEQVLVAFENNHPAKPYVLTGMYNGVAKPELFDPDNNFKGFKSRSGNQWKFDDKDKSILIAAPNSITLSAGKTVNIQTGQKDDKTEININVGQGTINVNGKIINIEAAETINMNAKKEIKAQGTQKVEVKGTNVSIEGSAKSELKGAIVDVSGSGPVNVKGLPIKLN